MPTYEYRCTAGHEFTAEQSINDAPLIECMAWVRGPESLDPYCLKPVKRLISQTSFVLRGDGWAKDKYSSDGSKKK